MSTAQASEMLDLLMSHKDSFSSFDAQALVNLADAAESMGRSEDAEYLLGQISKEESQNGWVGLATAKRTMHKNLEKSMEIVNDIISRCEEEISSAGDLDANSEEGTQAEHLNANSVLHAAALNLRGQIEADSGNPAAAKETWSLSIAIKGEFGDIIGQANGHHNLLQLAKQQDDLEEALLHANRVLEFVQKAEDVPWQAHALADLAHLTACNEEFDLADLHYRSSLELAEEIDDLSAQVIAHWGIADLALIRGDGESALTAYGQALAAHMKLDIPAPEALLQRINAITEQQ